MYLEINNIKQSNLQLTKQLTFYFNQLASFCSEISFLYPNDNDQEMLRGLVIKTFI